MRAGTDGDITTLAYLALRLPHARGNGWPVAGESDYILRFTPCARGRMVDTRRMLPCIRVDPTRTVQSGIGEAVPKWRKKPIVVEAVQWNGMSETSDQIRQMARTARRNTSLYWSENGALFVQTIEGEMRVPFGWWVVRGVEGELYPVDPIVFAQTYESL